MSMKISKVLIEFFKENEKLNNHDLYIKYLHNFCKSDFEKALVTRIHMEAFWDNTIIRYRNHLIKEWVLKPYSIFREKRQRQIAEFYSPLNRVIQWFKSWFK